jgi:thiol-disulfide isomerase/thioredoxin
VPRILDFTQVSCKPCQAMKPILAEASSRCGVAIENVDVATPTGKKLAGDYGVTGTPALLFLGDDGRVTRRLTGMQTLEAVVAAITEVGLCAAPSAPPSSPSGPFVRPVIIPPIVVSPTTPTAPAEPAPVVPPLPPPVTNAPEATAPPSPPPYTPPYSPPPTPPTGAPMAVRIVEIVQATCHYCVQVAPAVAAVNAACGNPIEQIDAATPAGAALAAQFGVTGTPTFLFIENNREVRPRISNVVDAATLRAAVVAAGRCSAAAPAPSPTPPPTAPTAPTAPPSGAVRVVEILQPSCMACNTVAPVVAAVNAACGNPIEQLNGRAEGAGLAAQFGVTTTPTFLFIQGGREVRPRIVGPTDVGTLRAAVTAVGRCAPTSPAPAPSAPTSPSTPPGGIPGGGYATSGGDVANLPPDLKVRALRALGFETVRSNFYTLASEVSSRGFSKAAARLRAVGDRLPLT